MLESSSSAATRGVNVAGYLRTESGVGAACRGYIRALRAVDVPTSLVDLSHLQINRSQDDTLTDLGRGLDHDINLICADVELHYAIIAELGESFFEDHYNVGIWAWELPRFPERWRDRLAFYDEIWVGTSFIANALAPVAPVPVIRIPPVLSSDAPGSRSAGRSRLGVADDELVFLFMFDFHSHAERKNPDAVVDAFRMAFGPGDRARLVIKCVNDGDAPDEIAAMQDHAGDGVSILRGYWPRGEVRDLMAACDAYISLHRSEGTGLTITDAMALGKPVIATGWSGNMDVMTIANSFPAEFELNEIRRGVGPYRAGEMWAEPSVEHAAKLMRKIAADPDLARRRGERAHHDVERAFSSQAIGTLIKERLAAIDQRRNWADCQRASWATYRSYRDLASRLRGATRQIPSDATVLVVSKGDRSLVQLGDSTYWHFPCDEGGEYAGYYPADGPEAISQLEAARARGAGYLLFPSTAFWWLEHYGELTGHLDGHYRRVFEDEDCILYALDGPRALGGVPGTRVRRTLIKYMQGSSR